MMKLASIVVLAIAGLATVLMMPRGGKGDGLVFEKAESFLKAKPSDSELLARFPFTNRGAKEVTIRDIKTDCSCTVADLTKRNFAPGESGEIVVRYSVGARTGLQRQGVILSTDDPAKPLVPLSVIVSIPEVMKLGKNMLLWAEGEPAEPKSLTVTTSESASVQQLLAGTDSPHLGVAVERTAPTEFRVEVTPAPNRRDITAALRIEAVLEGGQRKQMNALVRVR